MVLRSSIPLSGLGNANSRSDCWGYVSPSGREYALVTVYDGMFVYEITDPGSPQESILSLVPTAIGTMSRCTKTIAMW